MPRALITGISGFVGPHLAVCLRDRGIDCSGFAHGPETNPLRSAVRMHDIDIRDRAAVGAVLDIERPDYVYHLAALSHVPTSFAHPDLAFDVNVGGTLNLLEGLRRLAIPARVVLVSSGNLYGDGDPGQSGFSEEHPVRITSPYATGKWMSEELGRSYVRDFGLHIVIARPFNHTGPGQAPSFACARFAQAIAVGVVQGRRIHLRTGALDPQRDISDVRDVVRAYALLAEQGAAGQTYNVCSGTAVSIREVLLQLAEIAGVSVTSEVDPALLRPNEILRSGGSNARIHQELGWSPQIPFATTLRDLLDYWIQRERGLAQESTTST